MAVNVGNFGSRKDGSTEAKPPDLYVFPCEVVKQMFVPKGWSPKLGKFFFKTFKGVERYKNDRGIELIAKRLRVDRPLRPMC